MLGNKSTAQHFIAIKKAIDWQAAIKIILEVNNVCGQKVKWKVEVKQEVPAKHGIMSNL